MTEISGEAGSGKTNLCLMIMIQAIIPIMYGGLESNALYINTVKAFPDKRLEQLLDKYKMNKNVKQETKARIKILNYQSDQFEAFLNEIEEYIIKNSITVLIIDSIASLCDTQFINENNEVDYQARSAYLKK